MEPVKLKTYSKKEMFTYLISLGGQNIIYNVIGAGLAYYLQFTILLPAIAVSIIMAVARVWDAVNDPMMGTLVDKTRSKKGKCRPYLLYVPIPIFIITVLCFTNFGFYDANGDGFKNAMMIVWAAFTYILWGMTYTIGDIPLWSITALMTESDKDRNKLLSLARVVGGIGGAISLLAFQPVALALGAALAPSVGGPMQGEKYGFLITAIIFSLLGAGLFQLAGFFVKEKIPPSTKTYSFKDNVKIMVGNKPFRQILLSGILGSTKMLIALSAMPLVTYYFASKDPSLAFLYMVLLGGGLFAGQFISMMFTPKLLTKFSKKNLYNYANLLGVVPYLMLFGCYLIAPQSLVDAGWVFVCFLLFMTVGVSLGITTVLQSLMIADCIDYEEYVNGTRPDGVFFSGQSFITKLSTGVATLIAGIAYTVVGFSDSRVQEVNDFIQNGGIPRDNPDFQPFMFILFFLVTVPPALGCLLSVIPTWKYSLDDKEHARILNILNQRRREKELDLEIK